MLKDIINSVKNVKLNISAFKDENTKILESLEAECTMVEAYLDEQEQTFEKMKKSNEEYAYYFQNGCPKCKELEDAVQALDGEMRGLKDMNVSLDGEIRGLKDENVGLKTHYKKLESEHQNLENAFEKLSSDYEKIKNMFKESEKRNDERFVRKTLFFFLAEIMAKTQEKLKEKFFPKWAKTNFLIKRESLKEDAQKYGEENDLEEYQIKGIIVSIDEIFTAKLEKAYLQINRNLKGQPKLDKNYEELETLIKKSQIDEESLANAKEISYFYLSRFDKI